MRIERLVDDPHRALQAANLMPSRRIGHQRGSEDGQRAPASALQHLHRLHEARFIRPIASVSTPISSWLFVPNGRLPMPMLTWSAIRRDVTRRITIMYSITLSSTKIATNTTASEP